MKFQTTGCHVESGVADWHQNGLSIKPAATMSNPHSASSFSLNVKLPLCHFTAFEPKAVSDWSFDENCLFCCLRRDKVKVWLFLLSFLLYHGNEGVSLYILYYFTAEVINAVNIYIWGHTEGTKGKMVSFLKCTIELWSLCWERMHPHYQMLWMKVSTKWHICLYFIKKHAWMFLRIVEYKRLEMNQ